MKGLLVMVFTLAAVATAGAQSTFRGTVKDSAKDKGVGYATVAALRDSTTVAAVAADAEGRFELKVKERGRYTVEVSAVGYTTLQKQVEADAAEVDLGQLCLTEGVEVDAVAVTVQRPIVTNDAEKLTYSVEDDPEAQSSTLEEIIRKVPQLSIDGEGNVLMNGQSDYKVLVNGRSSGSVSRNFKEVIKSMPASSIKRIEVITNPSMKYDAEGAGGVLNIITSKARFDGYNGFVSADARNFLNRNWMGNGSANFTISKDKFSLSTSLYYGEGDMTGSPAGRTSYETLPLDKGVGYAAMRGEGDYSWRFRSAWGNINASYQIDSLNLLTAEVSVWGGKSQQWQTIHGGYYDAEQRPISEFTNSSENRYPWMGIDAAINYEHRFGNNENHTLTISDNVSIMPTVTEFGHEDIIYDTGATTTFDKRQHSRSTENVFQVDYRNVLTPRHSIEAGLKHTFHHSRLLQEQATATEQTLLARNIAGVYAGYGFTHEKVMARVGARLEGAWYNVTNSSGDESKPYRNALIDAIPYASVTYLPKAGHSLSFSYTERLSRPGVYALSPYVVETQTIREYGNPDLRTGIRHALTLKYAYTSNKWSASVGATVMLSNNAIANYSFVDEQGVINMTYDNNGRNRAYGGDVSLSYRPSHKFSLALSGRAGWIEIGLPSQGIHTSGWAISESLNMTIALWKGARLTLSEYAMLPDPRLGIRHQSWYVGTSLRLGQKFLKERLEVAITARNPHAKWIDIRSLTETPTFVRHASQGLVQRDLHLSVSFRFGKQGLYVKRTNRKTDDSASDVGGSSGGATTTGGGVM